MGKKTYSHRLFEAVNQDLQQRGDITAIFCGDFNLIIEDSQILQRWYKHGPCFDSHVTGTPESRHNATCHQGKGSRIDFTLASKCAFDLVSGYQSKKIPFSSNHSLVEVKLAVPKACQVRRTQRMPVVIPELQVPSSQEQILPDTIPQKFQ